MKNFKMFQMIKESKWKLAPCIVATSFSIVFTSCSKQELSNNSQEISATVEFDCKEMDDVPNEEWATPTGNGYLEVDIDLMLSKKMKIPKTILENLLVKNKISEIKNYFESTPLYCLESPICMEDGLSLLKIDGIGQYQEIMDVYYHEKHGVLSICYTNEDDLIYPKIDVESYYLFNSKKKLVCTNDVTTYADLCGNSYKEKKYNGEVEVQKMSFNGVFNPYRCDITLVNGNEEKKLMIEYHSSECLYGTKSCDLHEISITIPLEQYLYLSQEMKNYYETGNIVGFMENNSNYLKENIKHIKQNLSQTKLEEIYEAMDFYKEYNKVLTK